MREMYESCGPALLNYLLGMMRGDRYRAEDILQETLMRAWRHPEVRGPDGQWSRTWLFTVARNIAIDHLRAQHLRPVELGDHHVVDRPSTEDIFQRMVDGAEVRAALEALPSRLRDVLVELYLGEQSVSEVAQLLGIPPGTVKSRTFYALRALREELRARGFELSSDPLSRVARRPGSKDG
jgi:RNA polymerase sigma-70 factor (ECF subfamily)